MREAKLKQGRSIKQKKDLMNLVLMENVTSLATSVTLKVHGGAQIHSLNL